MSKKTGCDEEMVMNGEDNLGDHCSQTSKLKSNDSAKELGEEEASSDSIIN
jgi:hypothetical protein